MSNFKLVKIITFDQTRDGDNQIDIDVVKKHAIVNMSLISSVQFSNKYDYQYLILRMTNGDSIPVDNCTNFNGVTISEMIKENLCQN